jgi:hypothetical protein
MPYLVYHVFLRGREDEVSDNLGICGTAEGIALVSEFFT